MIKELNAAGYTYAYEPAKEGNALTLLLLHGTGGDHTSFIGLGRLVSPGASLIALKGNVNENGNLRFFRRHGEGVYDMDDLAMRTLRLADAIPELLAEHGRDPAMVVGIGYSNGANLLGNLVFERPGSLAGAVLMHPLLPYEPPMRDLSGKPVLITYGRRDPVTSTEHVEEIISRLRERRADVTADLMEAGHEVRDPELKAVAKWLKAFGKGDPEES